MDSKKTALRNALCNWGGMAVHMLVGFLIAPFLVRHLGQTTYGLWIVIGSFTNYIEVLDLGVSGSVGRNIAFSKARNDLAGVNGIFNTAFFFLCGVATLSLLAILAVLLVFFSLIEVPPEEQDAARIALVLVGLNFALSLPLQAFDGILWAYQRFDLQTSVDVPIVLLRAGMTYWLIGSGHGLVALGLISLGTTVAGLVIKAMLARWQEPALRVRFALANRQSAASLFGYSIWYFTFSLIKRQAPQLIVLIVGNRLGPFWVTPLSIATRLVSYANQFLIAGTGVLTPHATALHARDDQERQRSLLIVGGRGCLALTILFVSLFVFLGQALIRLWMGAMGPALAKEAFPVLLILAAGELLPMSQHITFGMILGRGNLRILAASSVVEICTSTTLALLASAEYGLIGVAAAVAIPATLCRGITPMVYACRAVGVPVGSYLVRSLLPAVLVAAGPVLLLGALTLWWTPDNWPELFLCGGVYALFYAGVTGLGLFGLGVIRDLVRRLAGAPPEKKLAGSASDG
jgi:O-antigen/teichoic acid export membrane protein